MVHITSNKQGNRFIRDNSDPKRCERTMFKKIEDIYNEPIRLKIEDN